MKHLPGLFKNKREEAPNNPHHLGQARGAFYETGERSRETQTLIPIHQRSAERANAKGKCHQEEEPVLESHLLPLLQHPLMQRELPVELAPNVPLETILQPLAIRGWCPENGDMGQKLITYLHGIEISELMASINFLRRKLAEPVPLAEPKWKEAIFFALGMLAAADQAYTPKIAFLVAEIFKAEATHIPYQDRATRYAFLHGLFNMVARSPLIGKKKQPIVNIIYSDSILYCLKTFLNPTSTDLKPKVLHLFNHNLNLMLELLTKLLSKKHTPCPPEKVHLIFGMTSQCFELAKLTGNQTVLKKGMEFLGQLSTDSRSFYQTSESVAQIHATLLQKTDSKTLI